MSMVKKLVLTGICVAVVLILCNYAFAADSNDTGDVRRLEMRTKSITLKVNQDKTLYVDISPVHADNKTIVWTSSDTGVVTVYDRGRNNAVITGVGEGTADVTATSHNGKATVCRVTVSDDEIKVHRLEMVNDTATVRVNQERTLLVDIIPNDSDKKKLEWTSSNPEVAIVDDGVVTGISPGTAEITVTSKNGKTAKCTVTVPSTVLTGIEQQMENADHPRAEASTGDVLSAAKLRLQVETAAKDNPKKKTVTLTYSDKMTVSTAALRSAAFTAEYNSVSAVLQFNTLDESGKVQGRLAIRPENAGDTDREISLGVYTNGKQVSAIKEKAADYFGTQVAVVRLTQTKDFGMPVEVSAKADLTGINTQTMNIYRYSNGSYTKQDKTELRVDNNGNLRFTVAKGGTYIIVSK